MPIRQRAWAVGGAAAVAVGLVLTVTLAPATAPYVPTSGPWLVVVQPTRAEIGPCVVDPAVEYAITPLPLPPAPTTVAFVPEAERDDVRRVVGCLVALSPRPGVEVQVV